MSSPATRNALLSGAFDRAFRILYGEESEEEQLRRYLGLLEEHAGAFPKTAGVSFFSASGRTELGGNHTDHNRGRVLAASIQLDALAAASPADDSMAIIRSHGIPRPIEVDLDDCTPRADETGSPEALVRGVAARLSELGYPVGGFRAVIDSTVLPGSGLSSSAAFEVLIGTILNRLHPGGKASAVELARAGQWAENRFFGKPCGLMDQIACSWGGVAAIDFADPEVPRIEGIAFSFATAGYSLLVVDTGGSHADLTPDYAAVPREMRSVAERFGREVLAEVGEEEFRDAMPDLRAKVGDRAVLRAMHFFDENRRVPEMADSLRAGDIERFLELSRESGDSSFRLLQNGYSPRKPGEQGITLALAESERFLRGEGVCRVHGGGFAGTVQAFVPVGRKNAYVAAMERLFGRGCTTSLSIRPLGAVAVTPELPEATTTDRSGSGGPA